MHLLTARSAIVLALGVGTSSAAPGEPAWEDLELPRGFGLELATGIVSNRAERGGAALVYEAGELRSAAELRVLEPSDAGGPRVALERGEGGAAPTVRAEAGLELGFDLGPTGWGYLRVLEASPERVLVEYAFDARADARLLARRPAAVRAAPAEGGVELAWGDADPGVRVERRIVGRAGGAGTWEEVGTAEASPFLDAGAPADLVLEYRVAAADGGPAFGARVRTTARLLEEDRPIALLRGQTLSLLSGATGGPRNDLSVEFVGNGGAHLSCGPGVGMRVLNPVEGGAWELPGPEDGGYRDQRLFLQQERALAVRLPEGLYARVRLEAVEGGDTLLYRQIDLAGARVFPPAPAAPDASWEAGRGVVLRFSEPPGRPNATPLHEVEREESYGGGTWARVAEPAPDAREWVDPAPSAQPLARYRLRLVLEAEAPGRGRRSLPGPPATVLLGDDRGPGTAALLERAVAEIAHPEFERRLLAEGILSALGPRAWPELQELLSSEHPEAVAAARRILGRSAGARAGSAAAAPEGEEAPELAPLVLAARGRAEGLGEPPAGWAAPVGAARAAAILRGAGAPEWAALAPWRALVASADPDPGVRLVASACGAWPPSRRAGPPAFAPRGGAAEGELEGEGLALGLLGAETARLELLRRLDPSDPWPAYVLLQLLHELELARRAGDGAAERAALERVALGASLLERHARDDPADVFLSAALEVVEDPVARLAAAANLCDLRFGRTSGPPGGDPARPRAVVRLPMADGELLLEELEDLRAAGAEDVDLVLPAGEYRLADGRQSAVLFGKGLRLFGEGRPVLRFGLAVLRGADVVLEGLHLAPPAGSAVNVDRAACLLRDCVLSPAVLAGQATDGVLELDRCEVLVGDEPSQLAGGIRLGRLAMLLARDSLLSAGGGAVSGARTVYLERCAVDGGERNGIEGRIDGEVLLLDAYVRADDDALANVYAGALEGAILSGGGEAAENLGARVAVCPVHALHAGSAGDLQGARRAARCLVGR